MHAKDAVHSKEGGLLWHGNLLHDLSSSLKGQQESAGTKTCAPVKDGSFGRIVCKPHTGACAAFAGSIQDRDAAMMRLSLPLHPQHPSEGQIVCPHRLSIARHPALYGIASGSLTGMGSRSALQTALWTALSIADLCRVRKHQP